MIRSPILSLPIARFVLVGGTCFVASTALLVALCEICGVNYLPAFVLSFICGNVLGYLLNRRFTFAARTDRGGVLRYVAVNSVLLAANSFALKLLVERAHIWYLGATILLAAANTPVSFLIHRCATFRTAGSAASPFRSAHG